MIFIIFFQLLIINLNQLIDKRKNKILFRKNQNLKKSAKKSIIKNNKV